MVSEFLLIVNDNFLLIINENLLASIFESGILDSVYFLFTFSSF